MADDRYRDNQAGGGRRRSSSIFPDDDGGGRGLFQRARDEVGNWLGGGDEDRSGGRSSPERSRYGGGQSGFGGEHYRSNRSGAGSEGGGSGQHGGGGGYDRSGSSYAGREQSNTSHFDENYRRWREQQIARLDQEYEEYCRERQQHFESDFHSWREARQARPGESQGSESGQPRDSFGGESRCDTESLAGSGSALLGDDGTHGAGAATAGGGDASAMESSTGSSPARSDRDG